MNKKFLILIPTIYLLGFFLISEIQYTSWTISQFNDPKWGSPFGQIIGLSFHMVVIDIMAFLVIIVAARVLKGEDPFKAIWKINRKKIKSN